MDEISIDDASPKQTDQNKERINTTIREIMQPSTGLEEYSNENLLFR